ncbi:MAG: bifunctional 4-hydroxy-3-methylbut-2-enyl diphosphate reductase/30S ribosomal protein S1 [Lachnospiraceae bacterium]|nr:bifunctional 4-hydroxy-3-methylbut-2-enyl diphosphate reductase/30S ribosomal protein S1 [Lachnospiraceae bacterium]
MEITVAKSAGFCFGVNRAIEKAFNASGKDNVYTYGPLIHNKTVTDELAKKGVVSVDSICGIENGTIIIRSHGVGKEVYDQIKGKGLNYIDGTCPFVEKIHGIVLKNYNAGRKIIIIGDKNHPEVKGINGWCENSALILDNVEEARSVSFDNSKYTLVAQTTFMTTKFDEITEILKTKCNIDIYNTICSATEKRQAEAISLSKKVDKMVVIGDKNSSNTQKLFEICQKNCKFAIHIETIADLVLNYFEINDKIGITAGASTPPATIKEVVSVMSGTQNGAVQNYEEGEELTFQQLLDQSFVSLHTGDIVKGTVIQISNEEVSVNLGYKSDGIIPRGEFCSDISVLPSETIKPGDEIEVFVVRVNDGDGNVLLSKKRIEAQKGMEDIEAAFENKEVVTGKVIEVVKGGLIAVSNGIRVFIPSSQVSNRYIEDLSAFKGQELSFNIIELDKSKRRIIGGRKALIEKETSEKKAAVFAAIKVGDKIKGVVSRLASFGVFVDLGGVDGLIHISEMSWGHISNPKELLSEGQTVETVVIDVDREKGKISLSLKDIKSNPWDTIAEKYPVGEIVEGKVVRMVPFGVFIELEPGVDGLVHISQISDKRVERPEDELSNGQIIKVKVLEVNPEQKKISLSKKEVDSPKPEEAKAEDGQPKETVKEEELKEAKAEEPLKEDKLKEAKAEEPLKEEQEAKAEE